MDRFHSVVNGSYQNVLGTHSSVIPSVKSPVPTGCIPAISPVCVLGGFHHSSTVLYTTSEFSDIEVVEVSGKSFLVY